MLGAGQNKRDEIALSPTPRQPTTEAPRAGGGRGRAAPRGAEGGRGGPQAIGFRETL